ncbi:MAG TPA: hypothetical protein VF746_23185 [Longimicrobium sp.]|jgi:hypothetical protein
MRLSTQVRAGGRQDRRQRLSAVPTLTPDDDSEDGARIDDNGAP